MKIRAIKFPSTCLRNGLFRKLEQTESFPAANYSGPFWLLRSAKRNLTVRDRCHSSDRERLSGRQPRPAVGRIVTLDVRTLQTWRCHLGMIWPSATNSF